MNSEIDQKNNVYFYVTGVFSTDFIFDFETIKIENEYKLKIYNHLRENFPYLLLEKPSDSLVSGMVDNYSSPKVSSFLTLDISNILKIQH